MTKEKRERVRREKTRLQKQRVEWKKAHPAEAAEKAAANAADSAKRARVRSDRKAYRLIESNLKKLARAERRKAEADAVASLKKANAEIRNRIIKSRREAPPKSKRHILPAFMRRIFAGARRGA